MACASLSICIFNLFLSDFALLKTKIEVNGKTKVKKRKRFEKSEIVIEEVYFLKRENYKGIFY